MYESIEQVCSVVAPLKTEVWTTVEPVPFEKRFEGEYKLLSQQESWGELFDCGWFRFSGRVPEGMPAEELALRIDINGEVLIVNSDGKPVRGLTNVSSVFDRTLGLPEKIYVPFTELGITSGDFEVWGEAGCNDLFGELSNGGTLHLVDIVRRTPEMIAEHYDKVEKTFSGSFPFTNDGAPIYAVGHAHLDLVWLWPERESVRKGVRTFATALANQKKYPWYFFGASQPQLYRWVEQREPELMDDVKQAWRDGRWELQGAMWVESDTHLPDGESLMRQFIYGQMYWRENFGTEVKTVWLPDVFGYSGSLPAIARLNGTEYILTMKNAWNLCNKFPYNAFVWEGIDGTKMLAYRLPEETYNGTAHHDAVAKCLTQDAQREITGVSAMLYGIGDGGAGPGEAHLEMLSRLMKKTETPEIIHRNSEEFFRRLAASADKLPTVQGELYLENHQGTFTNCAIIKKINRSYEICRRNMEFVSLVCGRPLPEWYREFEEYILLTQFHDSIPGSSISRVYDEAQEKYEYWMKRVHEWYGKRSENIFFNPSSTFMHKYIRKDSGWDVLDVNPFSWGKPVPWSGKSPAAGADYLDNGNVRIGFAADGRVKSWKLQGRELLSAPAGFVIYADKGNAWNIDYGTYEAGGVSGLELLKMEISADGPAAVCRQEYKYCNSVIKAEFVLEAGSKVCSVRMDVDWHDPEHLLRFEIPSAVANREAVYAAQFGWKKFSTLNSTPVEKAQHEISAQRWVSIDDGTALVAAATDCKYGFAAKEGKLNLTLLRAAQYPGAFIGKDDKARGALAKYNDIGQHNFVFAFMADNSGSTLPADTAEWLGCAPETLPADITEHGTYIDWNNEQFAVTALRPAWYGGGVLLRVYERLGKGGKLELPAGISAVAVKPDGRELEEQVSLTEFHPFEIKTLRIAVK